MELSLIVTKLVILGTTKVVTEWKWDGIVGSIGLVWSGSEGKEIWPIEEPWRMLGPTLWRERGGEKQGKGGIEKTKVDNPKVTIDVDWVGEESVVEKGSVTSEKEGRSGWKSYY